MKPTIFTVILTALTSTAIAGVARDSDDLLVSRQTTYCNSGNCSGCGGTNNDFQQCCVQPDGKPTAGRVSESAEQAEDLSLEAPALFKSESQPAIRTLSAPNLVKGFDAIDTFEQSRTRYLRLDIGAKLLFSMDREFARHAHAIQNAAIDERSMRSNEALMQNAFKCVDSIKSGLPVSSRRFFAYSNFDHLSIERFVEAAQELKQAGIQVKEMDLYWDINLDDPSIAHDDDDDENAKSAVVVIPDSPEAPESTESSHTFQQMTTVSGSTSSTATSKGSDIAKPPPTAKASPPQPAKSIRHKYVQRSVIQRADTLDIREHYPRDPEIEKNWDLVPTPVVVNGKDFQCGISAIVISLEMQLPQVKRPSTADLQEIRGSSGFIATLDAFDEQEHILQQEKFYSPDVLFALLRHWGMKQNPELRFSMDCLLRDGTSRLMTGGDHPSTYHFSIYMDDIHHHYRGLKRKIA
ncbi:hypothetical protein CcaCcLH18_13666 [Colletotrichum camelliae]|nr:hypothetical protein CcaCcLH18_13666 [Colletotrichum camelliae]